MGTAARVAGIAAAVAGAYAAVGAAVGRHVYNAEVDAREVKELAWGEKIFPSRTAEDRNDAAQDARLSAEIQAMEVASKTALAWPVAGLLGISESVDEWRAAQTAAVEDDEARMAKYSPYVADDDAAGM